MNSNSMLFVTYKSDIENDKSHVEALNKLIQTNANAMKGFREAANAIDDPSVQSTLQKYADQREGFGTRLVNFAVGMNAEPYTDRSLLGAVHHTWIDLKGVITGGDSVAILKEAIRGEEVALEIYNSVDLSGLPEAMRQAIVEQHESIEHVKHDLEDMCEELTES